MKRIAVPLVILICTLSGWLAVSSTEAQISPTLVSIPVDTPPVYSTIPVTLRPLVTPLASVVGPAGFWLVTPHGTLQTNYPKFLTYANYDLNLIAGEYLVVVNSNLVSEPSLPLLARMLVDGTGGTVTHLFTLGFRGFSVASLNDAWAQRVSLRLDVELVRKNFSIVGRELRGSAFEPVGWNLDRIDQRAPFRLDRDYRFKTGPVGTNPVVPIYILDNGIYAEHQEFDGASGSRVQNLEDVTGSNFARCASGLPGANHGTAVASIAAGSTLGITPTIIKNVKIMGAGSLTCEAGNATTVAEGLEAVLTDMRNQSLSRAVVNLSLGWYAPAPDVELAIQKLQTQGAIVVAAAGNEDRLAADSVPANIPGVVTVGATDIDDKRGVFFTGKSNYGNRVDVWAPGVNIPVADWTDPPNPAARTFESGTSVAAPHVTGALALLWQQNPGWSNTQVVSTLLQRVTRNMLSELGVGSNNYFLYVGEDTPSLGNQHIISRQGRSGDLYAVQVSRQFPRVYVAGTGSSATQGPFAYAAYDSTNISAGPVWQATSTISDLECKTIHVSTFNNPAIVGDEAVYFGCSGLHNGAQEGDVIATKHDGMSFWAQPIWLGPGSIIGAITDWLINGTVEVFVVYSKPKSSGDSGTDMFISAFDATDGLQLGSVKLTGNDYAEIYNRTVGLVAVEETASAGGTVSLVAATYSDAPGPNRTFLWNVDPINMQVRGYGEVPVPGVAQPPYTVPSDGQVATALAVQDLEFNGSTITIAPEVYLATFAPVTDAHKTFPWGFIYRLNHDWTTGVEVEVVHQGVVNNLWSEDSDLYFAGITMRTFTPGDLDGVLKAGAFPDYDAFLGKSEGTYNSKRWIVTYATGNNDENTGYGGYSQTKGYIVGSDSNNFYVLEYPVY